MFVNFLFVGAFLLILQIICTSTYESPEPFPLSFSASNAFNNLSVFVVTFLVCASYDHLSFMSLIYSSVESTKSIFSGK